MTGQVKKYHLVSVSKHPCMHECETIWMVKLRLHLVKILLKDTEFGIGIHVTVSIDGALMMGKQNSHT